MIESVVLRDPAARMPERLGGSGLGLVAAEPAGTSVPAAAPAPVSPSSLPSSPFDRRDLVEIRGNVRPLAEGASLALGAADEEGGGQEGGSEPGEAAPRKRIPESPLLRQVLAAYDPSGLFPQALRPPPAAAVAAPGPPASAPGDPPGAGSRRARQLSRAFGARDPESGLGRLLDLAA